MPQSPSALICATHPLRPPNRARGGRVLLAGADCRAANAPFPNEKSEAPTPPTRGERGIPISRALDALFSRRPSPARLKTALAFPHPPKKAKNEEHGKIRSKTDKAREAHRVGKASRHLTRFGFFSRLRQQPTHRQAFINPGSLNARPAGMEPGAGRFRHPAILGADLVFADRMRAVVRPKQPAGCSGALRSASMEARTAPRRSSKCLVLATQQNANFADSGAAPDAAPNDAACERSAAFIS